jgi:hypothetical protein
MKRRSPSTKHLRQTIDYARYPLAPRLDPLKSILAKLDLPARRNPSRCRRSRPV